MFYGFCLNSLPFCHIEAHQIKEKTWSSRCWIASYGMKMKNLSSRNYDSRTEKMPAPFERLLIDICIKGLFGCFNQQTFKLHSEHWTLQTFSFVFCLPIIREQRHLDSAQWLSPQCYLNWKFFFKLSAGSLLRRVTKRDANFERGSDPQNGSHNAYFATLFANLSTKGPWRKECGIFHKDTSTLA